MAQRSIQTENLHDRVITEVLSVLNQEDYDIYTNPGQAKNAGVANNYPDLLMTLKGEKTVKFIIEVETSDSINITEADSQWKKYATEIKATFYLLIPESELVKANDLCRQIGINVRFATYSINQQGTLMFNFR